MDVPSLASALSPSLNTYESVVLLVDDQEIVAEAVKRMIQGQTGIQFYYCQDPTQALSVAKKINPTVILQDLVMPQIDGLLLVKYFRANPATDQIPIIVLSVKEDPQIKADAFALGANDYLVKLPDARELLARIRYHSSAYIRLLERNEAFQKLEQNQKILENELAEAAAYVKSLLPVPISGAIKTDWCFIPSTQLGGDAFGYHWIDSRHFAIYLLDVCGHGVGAALLSISVINVLRSYTLPRADFHDPASVLKELNLAFQMENHNDMFFTIWYGVYDKETRTLTYSSGGHPPALVFSGLSPELARCHELKTEGVAIGAILEASFENGSFTLGPYGELLVFSDGIFEIPQADGSMMNFYDFTHLLMQMKKKTDLSVPEIVKAVQEIQSRKNFADDVSLLLVQLF